MGFRVQNVVLMNIVRLSMYSIVPSRLSTYLYFYHFLLFFCFWLVDELVSMFELITCVFSILFMICSAVDSLPPKHMVSLLQNIYHRTFNNDDLIICVVMNVFFVIFTRSW